MTTSDFFSYCGKENYTNYPNSAFIFLYTASGLNLLRLNLCLPGSLPRPAPTPSTGVFPPDTRVSGLAPRAEGASKSQHLCQQQQGNATEHSGVCLLSNLFLFILLIVLFIYYSYCVAIQSYETHTYIPSMYVSNDKYAYAKVSTLNCPPAPTTLRN